MNDETTSADTILCKLTGGGRCQASSIQKACRRSWAIAAPRLERLIVLLLCRGQGAGTSMRKIGCGNAVPP